MNSKYEDYSDTDKTKSTTNEDDGRTMDGD